MTQIDQIKAEIEKRQQSAFNAGHLEVAGAMYQLLSFIESLEKEPRDCGKGIHKQEYTGCDMSWMDEDQRLDEVAQEYLITRYGIVIDQHIKDAFKAGAKLNAGQRIKAYCIKSYNPVCETPDKRMHGIEIIYEEKEDTPYVLAGDELTIQIQKL